MTAAHTETLRVRRVRTAPVALILMLSIAPAAVGRASSPIAGSDTSTISASGYGKANQHRVWYNSYQHGWDGLIPKNDGGLSASDHYIMKDVAVNQIFTSVELEDRNGARPDVYWDDAGKRLYVLGSHDDDTKFWLVTYDEVSDTYTRVTRARGVTVPGIVHAGANDPAALYMSPNGYLWVSVMRDGGLFVQRSPDAGTTWLPAPINLNASVVKGVTAWSHFTHLGTTHVGVFATENAIPAVATRFYYWRLHQDADPTDLTNWTDESAAIPLPGAANADNHVSATRDSLDNQYFVAKTQDGHASDPLIDLYQRTPDGTWLQFPVTETREQPEQSRPSLVLDEDNDQVFIFTNDTQGGFGRRKRGRLSVLSDLATAPLTTVFGRGGSIFVDLISPREGASMERGTLILANEVNRATLWYSDESTPNCQVASGALTIKKRDLEWRITNVGIIPATIRQIDLTWPEAVGGLREVKRSGDVLYRTLTAPPSVEIASFVSTDPRKRRIDPHKTVEIRATFSLDAPTALAAFRVRVAFEEGCTVALTP